MPRSWMPWITVTAAVAGGLSFGLVHAGIRNNTPIFGSETGIFDAIVALLTLLALIAAGVGAFLSYRTGIMALDATSAKDRFEQFRTAAAMLGSNTDGEVIAGITLIHQLSELYPDPFEEIAFSVLRAFLNELSAEVKAQVWYDGPTTIPELLAKWPRSDAAEAPTFITLGALATAIKARNPNHLHLVDGRFVIYNVLLVDRVIYRSKFQFVHLDHVALDDVTFNECDFSGSRMVGKARSVTFNSCDLTDTEIFLQPSVFGQGEITFQNCITTGATYLGEDLSTFIARQQQL